MSQQITVTADVRQCPQCDGAVAVTSKRGRACWVCNIQWTFVPPEDEDDAEEFKRVNGRGWNEAKLGTKRLPISNSKEAWNG